MNINNKLKKVDLCDLLHNPNEASSRLAIKKWAVITDREKALAKAKTNPRAIEINKRLAKQADEDDKFIAIACALFTVVVLIFY